MSVESEAKPKGALRKFGEHPFVVLSGWLVGIVGVIFSVYTYYSQKPDLTYYISTTRTAIVQKGNLDNFSVTFLGTQITNDLSSAEIQIWNNGKSPIRREGILKTIGIRTANGEPIYQVTEKSTRDVIGFNWLNSSNHESGVLQFDWKILEQNDGIKIQIIYGGSVSLPLILDGVIEGQQQGITEYQKDENFFKRSFWPIRLIVCLFVGFIMFISLMRVVFAYEARVKYGKSKKSVFYEALPIVFGIVFYYFFYLVNKIPNPPFGF